MLKSIKLQLSGDIVTNLQLQIDELKELVAGFSDRIDWLEERAELLGSGHAKFSVSLKYEDGTPAVGLIMTGIQTKESGEVRTDFRGIATGYAKAGSVRIGLVNYADIVAWTETLTVDAGTLHKIDKTLVSSNFYMSDYSTDVYFTDRVRAVDFALCGGGGGGAGSLLVDLGSRYKRHSGGGGGGGMVSNGSFDPEFNTPYPLSVGSGGSRGRFIDASESGVNYKSIRGGDGGSTTFNGITASGGQGGGHSVTSINDMQNCKDPGYSQNGIGGTGHESGSLPSASSASGKEGTQHIYKSFLDTKLCGGGGGAGADEATSDKNKGGNPYGGAGAFRSASARPGRGAGGGGGGGVSFYTYIDDGISTIDGASGGQGVGTFRIYFKQE